MKNLIALLSATTVLTIATPVAAQDHSMQGMNMPGMSMPAAKKKPAKAPTKRSDKAPPTRAKPEANPAKKQDRASMSGVEGMDHSNMPGMDMSGSGKPDGQTSQQAMPGMGMDGMAQTGTALPAGNAPAPAPPMDHYADRTFPVDENARARSTMMKEQGGQNFYQILLNLAEYQVRNGRDGYRWDGEAWFGGDINRLTVKSEGEGVIHGGIEAAEVQALYSRMVSPYFSIQGGVRHNFQPSPDRTYATIGFEGLSPYMFEVEGALFLSGKGDLLGRLEGYYDQRVTQRLILQPRVEMNFAAQDVPENRIGSGLSNAELGLRLRYEIKREFAPYVGVSWDRRVGNTARFYRASGDGASSKSIVAGIRMWF